MKTYFTPEQIHAVSRVPMPCRDCGRPTLVPLNRLDMFKTLKPYCEECYSKRMYLYHQMQSLYMYTFVDNGEEKKNDN